MKPSTVIVILGVAAIVWPSAVLARRDEVVVQSQYSTQASKNLTDPELVSAATACWDIAYQESELAKRMVNPITRATVEQIAQRYARLAQKLEAERKK